MKCSYKIFLFGVFVIFFNSECFAQNTEGEWKQAAIKKYPTLVVKDSEMNLLFVKRFHQLKESGPELLNRPAWPMAVADECNEEIVREKENENKLEQARVAEVKRKEQELLSKTTEATPQKSEGSKAEESNFSGWTSASNGYTWRAAPSSAKSSLCNKLANVSLKKRTASFYYGALDSLFDTSDSYVLNTSLDGALLLIEASE